MPATMDPTVEEIANWTGTGDHDKFSHYVKPKSALTEAMVNGTPVKALCGKVWVPTRNPDQFPVCPECKERYNEMPD